MLLLQVMLQLTEKRIFIGKGNVHRCEKAILPNDGISTKANIDAMNSTPENFRDIAAYSFRLCLLGKKDIEQQEARYQGNREPYQKRSGKHEAGM